MKKTLLKRMGLVGLGFIALLVAVQIMIGNSASPPVSKTGAPSENRCNQCHGGTAGTGSVSMVFGNSETQYVPGQQYTITTNVTDPTKLRFGFQITGLAGGVGPTVGTFAVTNSTNTISQSATVAGNLRRYIAHRNANSNQNWSFTWTAPATDVGPITFFLVGIAANNNNNDTGDKLYSTTFTITAVPPPPPVAAFSATDTSACMGATVTFNDESTNSPSSHTWLFPGGNPASSNAANPSVTYATPGFYDVTLISGNVSGADTIVLTNYIHVYDLPTVAGIATPISCFGGADGSIDLTVNGAGGFTYLWSTGATTEDVSGLGLGTVSVTVTDANGCTNTADFTTTAPSEITVSFTSQPSPCGQSVGSATATGAGGVGGYTYIWSTGDTTATAGSLGAGTYDVTVFDANGCSAVSSVAISNIGAPTGSVASTPVTCFGDEDGDIDLTVTGGTAPYTYQWSTGATSQDITGLAAGTYSVTVTSFDGCVLTQVIVIDEPLELTAIPSSTPEMNGGDGTATVVASGGNGGYTYLWSDGQTTATAVGLNAGAYTVTVTDSNGCTVTTTVNVSLVISVMGAMPKDLFTVGPNPFYDYFTLSPNLTIYGKFVVHLVDIEGRIVYGASVDSKGAAPIRVAPGPLPVGVYLLTIQTAKGTMHKKLLHAER